MKLLQTLQVISRTDQLIRLKATGTSAELAKRLTVSERSVRRLLTTMKQMGAPIKYCTSRKTYYYEETVHFRFGFYCKQEDLEKLYGGTGEEIDYFSELIHERPNNGHPPTYFCSVDLFNRNLIS